MIDHFCYFRNLAHIYISVLIWIDFINGYVFQLIVYPGMEMESPQN